MAMRMNTNFSQNRDATVEIKRNTPTGTKYTLTISFEFDADEITADAEKDPGSNDYAAFGLNPNKIGETVSLNAYFVGAGDSAYFGLRSIQIASNGRKVRSGAAPLRFASFIDSLDEEDLRELKDAINRK